MEHRLKLSKKGNEDAVDPSLYRSIVGGLRYLVHTRLDICFAVGYLSRYMEAPTSEHWSAVKHLLRFIAGTRNLGCTYARQDTKAKIAGFSDADWVGDVDDRKSTSGVLFFLADSPISWQSAKQKIGAFHLARRSTSPQPQRLAKEFGSGGSMASCLATSTARWSYASITSQRSR
jgi:hypothetical protein